MENLTPAEWKRAEPIIDRALDLPAEEQIPYLDEALGDDPGLRIKVERLLKACYVSDPVLDRPAIDVAGGFMGDEDLVLTIPAPENTLYGAYRVVEELGRGGMGIVYLAERMDGQFVQRVALKVLRRDTHSEELLRRFLYERRILASLNHPNIARLFDGGISDAGAPYFVMEFVEGAPIDVYARAQNLSLGERLRLFEEVCQAVRYAHQNMVVHRDLKPSNIFVTVEGTVKLLDFGIAKLLDNGESLAEDAPLTRTGFRVLTPEYASPEQVRGGSITTATDVYALGIILYELLVGKRPYDVRGKTPSEIERLVCEIEPARPSTALQRRLKQAGEETGQHPPADKNLERLPRRLRGDLDTIILKALRKEPERRYESVEALIEDLRRYRENRPVLARPDTFAYRTRKYMGRHKIGVTIAVLLGILLFAGGVRERHLRARAEAESHKAQAVKDFLVSVFEVSDPYEVSNDKSKEITARELLDKGAQRVETDLKSEPEVRVQMLQVLGKVYMNMGLYEQSKTLLERSLEQRNTVFRGRDDLLSQSLNELGELYRVQGRFDEAEPLIREGLDLRRNLYGNNHPEVATSLDNLATLLQEKGLYDQAEPLFVEALAIKRRVLGDQHLETAMILNNLGLLYYIQGDYDRAEPLYRESMAIKQKQYGDDHPYVADGLQNLAQLLQAKGEYEESERLYRESLAIKRKVYGNLHKSVTVHLNNLGELLRQRGRVDEAEALFREALSLDLQLFGEEHHYVAASMGNLLKVLQLRGEFGEAERLARRALEINRTLQGDENTRVALATSNLAMVLYDQGKRDQAEPLSRRALALYRKHLGDEHPNTLIVSTYLARMLIDRGAYDEANRLYQFVIDKTGPIGKPGQMSLGLALVGKGQIETLQGKAAQAIPEIRKGLDLLRDLNGDSDWRTAQAKMILGLAYRAAGRQTEARPLLVEARTTLENGPKGKFLVARAAREALGN